MKHDLTSLMYLLYRLTPYLFILYFAIGSIINSEIKGFIYLVGAFLSYFISSFLLKYFKYSKNKSVQCLTMNVDGLVVPLSMFIISYTFGYLLYPIVKYDVIITNIMALIFFPIIILLDLYWNYSFECYSILQLIATIILSGGLGTLWSYILDTLNLRGLIYFNVGTNSEMCKRPSRQKMKCTTYQGGEPVNFKIVETFKGKKGNDKKRVKEMEHGAYDINDGLLNDIHKNDYSVE